MAHLANTYWSTDEEVQYGTSDSRREIGFVSAVFLIFNRMVGTGIFATPSSIVALSGSVGLSLFLWVVGMLIAYAGMMVYMEFGTTIPRNGGEKNYLEYVYRKPKFLVTAMYSGYVVLLGWAGSNSVVFGEYILNAAGVEVTRWNQRGVGLACITSAFLIHACALTWGLRLQNLLGIVKLLILLLIIVSGFVSFLCLNFWVLILIWANENDRLHWVDISKSRNRITSVMPLKAQLVAPMVS
jgi:amino acid transporter